VDPLTSPLEAVDAAVAHRTATADAAVVAAWTAHQGELYAFLLRTIRDPGVAEDLLAEAFLRLTTELRAGRAPDNVRAWLYRVAANLATSRGRRLGLPSGASCLRARAAQVARAPRPPTSPAGPGQAHGALADLAPDARAALLLSAEGFTGVEIAAAIGRTDAATRTLLCRTRVTVRRRLEQTEASR
jgi:RNA polymerase sigma-70 factor (ECF subfamily)